MLMPVWLPRIRFRGRGGGGLCRAGKLLRRTLLQRWASWRWPQPEGRARCAKIRPGCPQSALVGGEYLRFHHCRCAKARAKFRHGRAV